MDFNFETIQTFLNTPISELTRDTVAIGQAKENLKRYECFNQLLEGRLNLLKDCKDLVLLELITSSMGRDPTIDRNFILGFKAGINSFEEYLSRYKQSLDYIRKEGDR